LALKVAALAQVVCLISSFLEGSCTFLHSKCSPVWLKMFVDQYKERCAHDLNWGNGDEDGLLTTEKGLSDASFIVNMESSSTYPSRLSCVVSLE
jgi:hypothetical protein